MDSRLCHAFQQVLSSSIYPLKDCEILNAWRRKLLIGKELTRREHDVDQYIQENFNQLEEETFSPAPRPTLAKLSQELGCNNPQHLPDVMKQVFHKKGKLKKKNKTLQRIRVKVSDNEKISCDLFDRF